MIIENIDFNGLYNTRLVELAMGKWERRNNNN